jgi:hypothetical protein
VHDASTNSPTIYLRANPVATHAFNKRKESLEALRPHRIAGSNPFRKYHPEGYPRCRHRALEAQQLQIWIPTAFYEVNLANVQRISP